VTATVGGVRLVLADGWSAWVSDRLLVAGEPLDELDPALVPHWIKRGWAVPAPRPEVAP
jgi:hypothetical protein